MKTFTTNDYGRFFVIHLGKGELLLESIQSEIDRLGIQSGVITSGIGSLRKMTLHIITSTDDTSVNEYITIEAPIEISAIQGVIIDGEPHFHIVCSDPEKVYTGHLEDGCEVQYLAEISILEVNGLELKRKCDEFGINYIDYK